MLQSFELWRDLPADLGRSHEGRPPDRFVNPAQGMTRGYAIHLPTNETSRIHLSIRSSGASPPMSYFDGILRSFSRREKPVAGRQLPTIPSTTRYKTFLFCNDAYNNVRRYSGTGAAYAEAFWIETHKKMQYRHGTPWLTERGRELGSILEDSAQFVMGCDTEYYFDFLEDIFRSDAFFHVSAPKDELVQDINRLLEADGVPIFLTGFTEEEVDASRFGRGLQITQYPQVVLRTSSALHTLAVQPMLELLSEPRFQSANAEYLGALKDFRRGEYGECVTKCASTFESVLKVLCDKRKWPFKETDTASALLDIVLRRTNLDPYFRDALLLVATIRNRSSTAHGGGTKRRMVPVHLAEFALNATAAYSLLVAEEVKGR